MSGDTRDLIDLFVYYTGAWENNLSTFIVRRLSPGDIFVDVGANTGYYTLIASRCVGPSGAVVAIEASPSIFKTLLDHIALNDAGNIRVNNIAAADKPGKLKFYHGPVENRGESSIFPIENGSLECEVNSLPLDSILTADEIKRAKVVKIDVEGAEWLVVSGMPKLLAAGRQDVEIVVEISSTRLGAQGISAEEVVELFRNEGFFPYRLSNDYQIANNLPPFVAIRPSRIRAPIELMTDVVFSRIDADIL